MLEIKAADQVAIGLEPVGMMRRLPSTSMATAIWAAVWRARTGQSTRRPSHPPLFRGEVSEGCPAIARRATAGFVRKLRASKAKTDLASHG
jgi:hypothetical protein